MIRSISKVKIRNIIKIHDKTYKAGLGARALSLPGLGRDAVLFQDLGRSFAGAICPPKSHSVAKSIFKTATEV